MLSTPFNYTATIAPGDRRRPVKAARRGRRTRDVVFGNVENAVVVEDSANHNVGAGMAWPVLDDR
jgi:hypothetical protein